MSCFPWLPPPVALSVIFAICLAAIILAVCLRNNRRYIQKHLFFDPVTGGKNGLWYEKNCQKLIQQNPDNYYVLIVVNIDQFEIINESFGRQAGDRVLAHIYRTICRLLDSDERTARLNEDNFGLLLKNMKNDGIIQRIYDIATMCNDFNYHREEKYFLLLTFGIYTIDNHQIEFLRAQDYARSAFRKARGKTGEGLIRYDFFREDDYQQLLHEKALENRIENALANQDLLIYLQPKFRLKDDVIDGAEALVRWNDPEKGLIFPSEFIHLFERNGFIMALDLYVFRGVCALLRQWLDHGQQPVRISFNLSRVHLRTPRFWDLFEAVRQEYDVPAKYLEFELTENILYKNLTQLKSIFTEIHALGYCCSLDDFGSGYSSLNILKTISVDIIKLDRMFFLTEPENALRGQYIVESIVNLAKKLNIETVAEGVESPEQVQALKEMGCNQIQAFLYAKPLPIPEFEALAFGSSCREKAKPDSVKAFG